MMSYFGLILAFAMRYDKKPESPPISTMIPYSIAYLIGWIILSTRVFGLGPPVGPVH